MNQSTIATELQADRQDISLGENGEVVEVWEYFAENIDDFAAAKTLVDHFTEFPRHLDNPETDLLGLFLRAKLTLKRRQIAYAEAMAAVNKAREQSRTVRGVARSFVAHIKAVALAIHANPTPAVLAAALTAMVWYR
jgi:mRNA degradation ribonuclease J1/J2